MSSLAVFPAPGFQNTITITEYNSKLVTAEEPKECQPSLYTFGQVNNLSFNIYSIFLHLIFSFIFFKIQIPGNIRVLVVKCGSCLAILPRAWYFDPGEPDCICM